MTPRADSFNSPFPSAIAKEVFGLTTTIWNEGKQLRHLFGDRLGPLGFASSPLKADSSILFTDTDDWCLSEGGGTSCTGEGPADDSALDAEMLKFAGMAKSPGLVSAARGFYPSSLSMCTT